MHGSPDATVRPDANEVCRNGVDDNCDASARPCALESMSLGAADATYTGAGSAAVTAGDVNGDGYADVLVGAYRNSLAGEAYIWFCSGAPESRSVNAADVQLSGRSDGDWAGYAVSTAGDVDADGFDDVLVGAQCNDDVPDDAAVGPGFEDDKLAEVLVVREEHPTNGDRSAEHVHIRDGRRELCNPLHVVSVRLEPRYHGTEDVLVRQDHTACWTAPKRSIRTDSAAKASAA